ncbi:hypothetical protein Syun_001304 [Stephania yunnanensis]|uniref:Uncharacterized protein n=1 Tax=Stephania yunnanensis TaxID=152371 RepID=A0AAP0Q7M0_9MAGN
MEKRCGAVVNQQGRRGSGEPPRWRSSGRRDTRQLRGRPEDATSAENSDSGEPLTWTTSSIDGVGGASVGEESELDVANAKARWRWYGQQPRWRGGLSFGIDDWTAARLQQQHPNGMARRRHCSQIGEENERKKTILY